MTISDRCSFRNTKMADWLRSKSLMASDAELEEIAKELAVEGPRDRVTGKNPLAKIASLSEKAKRARNAELQRVRLFDYRTMEFPSGLINVVTDELDAANLDYLIHEENDLPAPDETLQHLELAPLMEGAWDHQIEAADKSGDHRQGMFAVTTGGGKTRIAGQLIARHRVRTLILVQTQELMYQIRDELQEMLGIPVGHLGDQEEILEPVTVAIVNSAYSKMDTILAYGFQQLIVDEAHHSSSKTHFAVVTRLNPYYSYGLTGTDFKESPGEGMCLKASFCKTIVETDTEALEAAGVIVPMRLELLECQTKYDPKLGWSDLHKAFIHDHERNSLFCNRCAELYHEDDDTILMPVDSVPHGEELLKLMTELDVPTVFCHAKTRSSERRAALEKLRDGEIGCLIGTLYDEGVNIKNLTVVANVAGKRSKKTIFQRSGRGKRSDEGKEKSLFLDCKDLGHRYLTSHSQERILHAYDAGLEVEDEDYEWALADFDSNMEMDVSELVAADAEVMAKELKPKKRRRRGAEETPQNGQANDDRGSEESAEAGQRG